MNRKICMLGSGAVAQCTLPILVKELAVTPSSITVIDRLDNRHLLGSLPHEGLRYIVQEITPDNIHAVLAEHVKKGDILIDLTFGIETMTFLTWCYEHDVLYVNSSVEVWDAYSDARNKDPRLLTLYDRQMVIREFIKQCCGKGGATAILDHGANPGLVSHFTKQAIEEIALRILQEKPHDERCSSIKKAIDERNFARLAMLIGLKTIHIAERDSQITCDPKKMNEFVNTWSIPGLYEEGIAPAELGWGTHEKTLPKRALTHMYGPKNQILLSSRGIDTFVRSWVPSGEIIGMVIRHGEAFGISDRLTVWDQDKPLYRPTVHYAYCISDAALASLYELKMRQLELQPRLRIMKDDIIDGKDELGCLLMGHDYKAWWIGSLLDIHEARRLVPGQNATTVQVAVAVVAAVRYMVEHPQEGICLPDDLDYREIMAFVKPYLGEFISRQVDWSPLYRKPTYFAYDHKDIKIEDEWQFESFLVG